jgi:hypothetical protein
MDDERNGLCICKNMGYGMVFGVHTVPRAVVLGSLDSGRLFAPSDTNFLVCSFIIEITKFWHRSFKL